MSKICQKVVIQNKMYNFFCLGLPNLNFGPEPIKTSFDTIWRAYTNWLYILNNSLEFKNLVEKRKHSARAELNLLFTGKQHSSRFQVDLAFA